MFQIKGVEYDAMKMPPRMQMHVLRRLTPLLSPIGPVVLDFLDETKDRGETMSAVLQSIGPLSHALATLPDELVDYVFTACLLHCKRLDGSNWHQTHLADGRGGTMAKYQDIDGVAEVLIVGQVLKVNSAGFTEALSGAVASPLVSEPQ